MDVRLEDSGDGAGDAHYGAKRVLEMDTSELGPPWDIGSLRADASSPLHN